MCVNMLSRALFVSRLLFWSSIGISRSNMAGNAYKSLVTDVVYVHGLAIDWAESRLFYVDHMSGILASVDFDGELRCRVGHCVCCLLKMEYFIRSVWCVSSGQGKQVVLHNLHFPHRLTIYEDQVFWADLHYGTVSAANKYTGSGRRVVYTNGGADKSRIFDVKLYDAFQETCKLLLCVNILEVTSIQ